MTRRRCYTEWQRAWTLLCLALALHVVDEALTDFLGFWNPAVTQLRESAPWLPLPTFRFDVWIGLLALAVVGLLSIRRHAGSGARWMRPVSTAFVIVMLANGMGHLALSLYWGRPAPGAYSSPLVLVAAAYLWRSLPDRSPQ